MKVLARCYDRALVRCGPTSVCEVSLGEGVVIRQGRVEGVPGNDTATTVQLAWDDLEVHKCDGCSQSYGPRGTPSGDQGSFQQYALQRGEYPWSGHRPGWYCMGCSMPPR